MKRINLFFVLVPALLLTIYKSIGQNKTGYISLNELFNVMPEFKKTDTLLAQFRDVLEQKLEAFKKEYEDQYAFLNSKDTFRYNKIQLEVKKQNLSDMFSKLQGYNQQASQLLDQKRQDLLIPIHKKATDAIQAVAKENGYSYVLEKDALYAYPLTDDLLTLVEKKLRIN
jgi:outer membrane protein